MIVSALLTIVYYLIYLFAGVILLLPDVTISDVFAENMQIAISYANSINNILPVTELFFTIVGVFIAYELGYLTLKLINWVIRKIPSIN